VRRSENFWTLRGRIPSLAILAVNVSESAVQVSSFAEQFRMKVPVVMDPQGEISDLYGVSGLPTTLFLDAGGRVLAVRPGAIDRCVIDEMMAVALQ
jgi:peroxiredoxin